MGPDVRGSARAWLVSATVGGVWLVVVLLSAVLSQTPLARVQQAVLPSGVTPYVWSWAAPWPVLLPLAGAVAVTVLHAAIIRFVRSPASFAATWLAVVVAGAAAGLTIDVTLVFGNVFTDGWAMWALELGSRAAVGAYWGLLYGWIPALLAVWLGRRDAGATESETDVRRPSPVIAVAIAVAGLVLLSAAQTLGDDATQAQLRQEQAAAEPPPVDGAARPDPEASGEPVPESVEGAGVTGVDGCTPESAMVLSGDVSGATGHRAVRLELMNFSDAPCVIEGYPDVAFGDQNGHLLDVTVERGGSFMAADPGPTRVEIPAGSSAVAYIGWDANSTHGVLVARTVWSAVLAGETRGSKPIESDVVEGSTVTITAWALPETQPTGP